MFNITAYNVKMLFLNLFKYLGSAQIDCVKNEIRPNCKIGVPHRKGSFSKVLKLRFFEMGVTIVLGVNIQIEERL